ncbi:Molybdenum-pterin-binding protein 2 [Nocardia cerradoensis]|uniref:Molybdenum-pterin-binding protein 2 n=1 Tax=Nocardia cerradoensis TaxID=85688 RepID=A0A231HEQ6_9NOCA|nr:Molybdenum-pterin-binding protein 2 [Nocardia cerradoensis]
MLAIVTNLRISEAAALLGVSDDTVRRWIEQGRLPEIRLDSGRKGVRGADLAEVLRGQHAEAHEPGVTVAASARNRMRGIVTRIVKDTVMAQVEMQAGPFRLVSLVSRESVDELGLEVGSIAVASVKSTHVVVEIPES